MKDSESQFTEDQRARLHAILKLDPDLTDQFLDRVQTLLLDYVAAAKSMSEAPKESSEQSRKHLIKVGGTAKKLRELIYSLNPDGSELLLLRSQLKLPHGLFDMANLLDQLGYLQALAHSAAERPALRGRGHPTDFISHRFIAGCVAHYRDVFGEMPKYTHKTKFQNFLKQVSADFCPPQYRLSGNLTRLITAAITPSAEKK